MNQFCCQPVWVSVSGSLCEYPSLRLVCCLPLCYFYVVVRGGFSEDCQAFLRAKTAVSPRGWFTLCSPRVFSNFCRFRWSTGDEDSTELKNYGPWPENGFYKNLTCCWCCWGFAGWTCSLGIPEEGVGKLWPISPVLLLSNRSPVRKVRGHEGLRLVENLRIPL